MSRFYTKVTVLVLFILLFHFISEAQFYIPIPVTGFNSDLIANGTDSVTASTTNGLDNDSPSGSNLYQIGYSSGLYGLPVNGIINSESYTGINYQLANYDSLNALLLYDFGNIGTLNLLQPGVFSKISLCATSTGASNTASLLSIVINFSDGTNNHYLASVSDWSDFGNYAINGIDRVNRDGTFQNNSTYPKLFDCIINFNAADKVKIVESIIFTNTSFSNRASIFAICGITAVGTPPKVVAANVTSFSANIFTAKWYAVAGATNYRIDISTDSTFSIFESSFNNFNIGNSDTSINITGLLDSTTYYYRVRAENANGQGPNSNIISFFTSTDIAPSNLSYNPDTIVATINTTNITALFTGIGNNLSYSISPALPTGVTLDTINGKISGIPTALSSTKTYKITAKNNSGIDSCLFTLTVKDIPPANLSYSPNNMLIATIDSVIVPRTPIVTGNVVSYSISPALTAGIIFDTINGFISGTPTTLSQFITYTITANNSGGTTSCQFLLTIIAAPPSNLTYSQDTVIATKDSIIVPALPTNSGGNIDSYNINPSLPPGLVLDPTTGIISGTPVVLLAQTTYTITAINTGGNTACLFTLIVNDSPPTNLHYSSDSITGTVNLVIAPTQPLNSGGSVINYKISPALPNGITFDTLTGIISGIPTVLLQSTTFKITATNSGGVDTCFFTLSIIDIPPSNFSYSPDSIVATKNTTNISLTPLISGGPVVNYSITPSLPTGVLLNPTSGVISGIPSILSVKTTYTITATNSGGSDSCLFILTVNAIPPSNFSYYPYLTNQATLDSSFSATPQVDGGAVVSYSIDHSLPNGITFDTITGIISGIPIVLSPVKSYKVIATNSGGSDSCTFILSVAPDAPIVNSSQVFCGSGKVSDLYFNVPSGLTVRWYISEFSSNILNDTTYLISGTTYYAEAWSEAFSIASIFRSSVKVTINPIPTLPVLLPQSTANVDTKLCPGDNIICVNFDNNYSYQWKLNNNNIIGQTGSTYSIPSLGDGNYSLYVVDDSTGCFNNSQILTIVLYTITTPIIYEKKKSNTVSILIADNSLNLYSYYVWTYADSTALPSGIISNRQFLILPPSNMNANYIVNITDTNGCRVRSGPKTVTLNKSPILKVYPTINNGSFKLGLTDAPEGSLTVKIFNQSGIELRTYSFENVDPESEYQINANGLTSGLYTVEITLGDNRQTQKIIIK